MGAGYVKANLKFVKIFFVNVMTFVWSVRFRTQNVRFRTFFRTPIFTLFFHYQPVNSLARFLLHIIYNATASPSERGYKSINESPEAVTFSWEFTTTPIDMPSVTANNETVTFKKSSIITIDTAKFKDANASRLELLKKVLYGTDGEDNTPGTDSTLPSPKIVYDILSGTITTLQAALGN